MQMEQRLRDCLSEEEITQFLSITDKLGAELTSLGAPEVSIRAVSENFELKVGNSKVLIPWNSYIVIDKEQPDPDIVGTIDFVK